MRDQKPSEVKDITSVTRGQHWPGTGSRFLLVIVASARSKQLLHGSRPRIEADPRKRRNTSIALEEVIRGLVPFTRAGADGMQDGRGKTFSSSSAEEDGDQMEPSIEVLNA
jgi:DNA-directed RNA polymerase omega subunit